MMVLAQVKVNPVMATSNGCAGSGVSQPCHGNK